MDRITYANLIRLINYKKPFSQGHNAVPDQAAAAARLRVQPHGRLRDGAHDEGEALLRRLRHHDRAEARPGDHLPRRAIHTARRQSHQGKK